MKAFDRSEVRKLVNLLLSRAVPLVASVLTTFTTAALLGPSERGRLALVISTASLVGAVSFLSLHVGMLHAVRTRREWAVRRGLGSSGLIAGIVLVGGVVAASRVPPSGWGSFTGSMLFLSAVGAALTVVNLVILRTVQGLGDHRAFRNAMVTQAVLFMTTAIPLTWLFDTSLPAICAWLGSTTISSAMGLLALRRQVIPLATGRPARFRELVGRSLPGHVGSSGQQILHSVDVIVLGALTGAAAVGVYSIAVALAGLVWLVSEALSLATFDSGTSARTEDEDRALFMRYSLIHLVFASATAIGVLVMTVTLVPLVLPQYDGLPILVAILLPGVLAQGQARIALARVTTNGNASAARAIGVTSAGLAILYIPFISTGGALGAALGSSVLYILQTAFVFLLLRRRRTRTSTESGPLGDVAA